VKDLTDFLYANINGFLATLEDGQPRVRPYQFMLEDAGRLCFSTNNKKEVCKQLKHNPAMEFACSDPHGAWLLRLRGNVQFTNEVDVKVKILAKSDVVRNIYKTSDHPDFEVFYLDHGSAQLLPRAGQDSQQPPAKQVA